MIETVRSGSGGSESRIGSVMGTPGYMPPEQARGETALIDERVDVFALGAILTEILTGKPPYTGSVSEQIRTAAAAELGPAHDRLDASGADPILVRLAKECMAPSRDARPRNAGEVASAVTDYLASLEARRRAAELDAAAARRTRRLSLALAATVLIALTLGGGGLYLADTAKRERLERARIAVDTALREVGVVLGMARSGGADDLTHWPAVLEGARAAAALASDLGADPEARREADAFLAQALKDEATAIELARIVEEDRELLRRIREVRISGHPDIDLPTPDSAYDEPLGEVGIHVLTEPPEEVAGRIRSRTIDREIIAALDDWVRREREAGSSTTRLNTLLGLLDADELRIRIREASAAGDLDALYAVLDREDLPQLPSDTVFLLADALGHAGDPGAAADAYSELRRRERGSFRSSSGLAYWLMLRLPPDMEEAVELLGPLAIENERSLALQLLYASAVQQTGRTASAISARRRILELAPDHRPNRDALARLLRIQAGIFQGVGLTVAASAHMKEAIGLGGATLEERYRLGFMLLEVSNLSGAEQIARELVAENPDAVEGYGLLGDALRASRQPALALQAYDRAEALSPRSSRVQRDKGRALASLGRLEEAVACWKKAAGFQPGYPDFFIYSGHALFRLGRAEEAIAAYERARAIAPQVSHADYSLFRAHEILGDATRARTHLDRAIQIEARGMSGRVSPISYSQRNLGAFMGRRYGGDEAIAIWDRWFPDAAPAVRAEFLCGLSSAFLSYRAEPVEARRLAEEAIRTAPEYGPAHEHLSDLLGKCGDNEEALTHARKASELLRGGPSLNALMDALMTAGRLTEAHRFAKRLAQKIPAWRDQLEMLSRMVSLREVADEILDGERVLDDPDDLYALSAALYCEGRYAEAYRFLMEHLHRREPRSDASAEVRARQFLFMTSTGIALLAADREGMVEEERHAWIEKALARLRDWMAAIEAENPYLDLTERQRNTRQSQVVFPLVGRAYACIRDEERVAELPEVLREECREVFGIVDRVWRRVR